MNKSYLELICLTNSCLPEWIVVFKKKTRFKWTNKLYKLFVYRNGLYSIRARAVRRQQRMKIMDEQQQKLQGDECTPAPLATS